MRWALQTKDWGILPAPIWCDAFFGWRRFEVLPNPGFHRDCRFPGKYSLPSCQQELLPTYRQMVADEKPLGQLQYAVGLPVAGRKFERLQSGVRLNHLVFGIKVHQVHREAHQ